MARQSIFLLALLVAATALLSHGCLIGDKNVEKAKYSGQLCCGASGNPEEHSPCSGVSGVNVTVLCNLSSGSQVEVGSCVTDSKGLYEVAADSLDGLSSDIEKSCFSKIALPVPTSCNCNVLSNSTGYLKGSPQFDSLGDLTVKLKISAHVSVKL